MAQPRTGPQDRSSQSLRVQVLAAMAMESPRRGEAGLGGVLNRLCRTIVVELDATGAAVNMMSPPGSTPSVIGTSDDASTRVDDLQFIVGEGPCHDALPTGRPVHSADLSTETRWPGYCSAALDCGIGSVYAFPLQVGAVDLGVLDLYMSRPRPLSEEDVSVALAFAEMATECLLHTDATANASFLNPGLQSALGSRAHLYQAQGMVMVDQDISLTDALVRIRTFSFTHRRAISDVARDIVAGTLAMTVPARP
ncbi:GAF domain-containing protein [soil metagenome]